MRWIKWPHWVQRWDICLLRPAYTSRTWCFWEALPLFLLLDNNFHCIKQLKLKTNQSIPESGNESLFIFTVAFHQVLHLETSLQYQSQPYYPFFSAWEDECIFEVYIMVVKVGCTSFMPLIFILQTQSNHTFCILIHLKGIFICQEEMCD